MDEQLRKRLEEAAEEYGKGYKTSLALEAGFMKGAEFGYKEAIKVAKGWLEENTETRMPDDEDKDFVWVQGVRYEDKDELIARFEADMSKLLEEKK